MAKTKTSTKQKKSLTNTPKLKLKKTAGLIEYNPTEELLNEDLIMRALWECLRDNDPEGVIEVIDAHLRAVNKMQQAKKAEIARSTMYHSLKGKNPTIRTLAKLIHAAVDISSSATSSRA